MPKPYKPRTKSKELRILEFLNHRMQLSDKDKQYYLNLKKGYEGEVLFDSMTEKLECDCYILNDLLLKVKNSTFQIDTTIITSDILHFFEVKNQDGDYIYESGRLFKLPQTEVLNPMNQIGRNEPLYHRLLKNLGFNMNISASVVFINPEFTMYQAPLDLPFIFPTQVNQFLKDLDKKPSKLNSRHKILADKLISLHIEESPFSELPSYDFKDLRKGLVCEICGSFSMTVVGRHCSCEDCDHKESVEHAVLRCVAEIKLLFPNMRITTKLVHEWCKACVSVKVIQRILNKYYKKVGTHQWTYYE